MSNLKKTHRPQLSKRNQSVYVQQGMTGETFDEIADEFLMFLRRYVDDWLFDWDEKHYQFPSSVNYGVKTRINRLLNRAKPRIKEILAQSNGSVKGYYRKAFYKQAGKELNTYHNGGYATNPSRRRRKKKPLLPLTFHMNVVEEAEFSSKPLSDNLTLDARVARYIESECEDWVVAIWKNLNWEELVVTVENRDQLNSHISETFGISLAKAKEFSETLHDLLAERRRDLGKHRRRRASEKARCPRYHFN